MQANLAILVALAGRPNGRITFAELDRQLEANEDGKLDEQVEQQVSAGSELIEAGLAVVDGDSLQITEAGRSVVEGLLPHRSFAQANSLEIIDHLVGADIRSRIFNLDLRQEVETDASEAAATDDEDDASQPSAEPIPADLDAATAAPQPVVPPPTRAPPSAMARQQFISREPDRARNNPDWRARTFGAVARQFHRMGALWRRHIEDDLPKTRTISQGANVNGIVIALVSLLVVIICAGAVVALRQIRSLETEISTLQRELSPLKDKLSRFDLAEKTRQAEEKAREERSKRTADNPPPQAPLSLSHEEIQLVREYIKPAPGIGSATAPAVGDPIVGTTIPFPSPVTEKVPKLLGAKFAIRNGAILVVRRDSHQIDAVLGPN
ncbi:hypothetical protein [Bradyrhizobium sp. CCBAU 53338]|uniref:hypothetical protein n=1 Tax=Bradyrhizobium sp. CCBAU 53338 TaxID=1325111 RepID=UPI001FED780F|nr:hypothetical protein [Bradyrhizobium sp. CCBAU 53338]